MSALARRWDRCSFVDAQQLQTSSVSALHQGSKRDLSGESGGEPGKRTIQRGSPKGNERQIQTMSSLRGPEEIRVPILRSCAAHMMSGLSVSVGVQAGHRPLPATERSESQESERALSGEDLTRSSPSGRPGRNDQGKSEEVDDHIACMQGGAHAGAAITPQSCTGVGNKSQSYHRPVLFNMADRRHGAGGDGRVGDGHQVLPPGKWYWEGGGGTADAPRIVCKFSIQEL